MSSPAKDILDTMLGYLGFVCDIDEEPREGFLLLQVHTPEKERLIGRHGEILEDVQFLLIGPIWLLADLYRRAGIPY